MTRYQVCVDDKWVAATYDSTGSGILLTIQREDACSWVRYETAVAAARNVSAFFNQPAWVHPTEEPDYPSCWNAAKGAARNA